MVDGIRVVTPETEKAEIAKAQTCTPRKGLVEVEYCCPFEGTSYKLDADGPLYYWNMVNSGGQPEQLNRSVVLRDGTVCQRWVDTDWPLFFKASVDVVKFVDQWIGSGDYGKIARLSTLTTDQKVAAYLLSKSDAVIKAIYEAETSSDTSPEARQHSANYTWNTFRKVRLQEIVTGAQK